MISSKARNLRLLVISVGAAVITIALIQASFLVSSQLTKKPDNMTGFNPKVRSALQEKMADKPSSPFRIVVEVIPGHIGETIQRLSVFGVVVEASHDNLIQALATSEQISLISADASVVRIRLPLTPEELNPAR